MLRPDAEPPGPRDALKPATRRLRRVGLVALVLAAVVGLAIALYVAVYLPLRWGRTVTRFDDVHTFATHGRELLLVRGARDEPGELWQVDLDDGRERRLFAAAGHAHRLAFDSRWIAFHITDSQMRGRLVVGDRERLAFWEIPLFGVADVAVGGGHIYVVSGGWLHVVADGRLVRLAESADRVAVNDRYVVWVSRSQRRVQRLPHPTGTAPEAPTTLLESELAPRDVALDDDVAYVLLHHRRDDNDRSGRLVRVPLDGSAPTTMARDLNMPQELLITDRDVVFVNNRPIDRDGARSELLAVPRSGGSTRQLLDGSHWGPLGLDRDGILRFDQGCLIRRLP